MSRALVLLGFFGLLWAQSDAEPSAQEIIRRSIRTNDADFEALPRYSHRETDITSHGSRTYEVMMLEGSPYDELAGVNGEPLPPTERKRAEARLAKEIARRKRESAGQRADRIAKYDRERRSEHLLMNEMAHAFEFKLAGESQIDGRPVYVLEATPLPGYRPPSEKARVLTGMKGTLWIDEQHYHWAKVEAEVIHPVNFGLFIAKVSRGTSFELDAAPVDPNVWLPCHFIEIVKAKILGIKSYHSRDDETYTDYRLVSQ